MPSSRSRRRRKNKNDQWGTKTNSVTSMEPSTSVESGSPSGEENGPDLLDDKSCDRHCAFCLKSISRDEVKLCGKCGRRAYCSKECQISDWLDPPQADVDKTQQRGQGHKSWCNIPCGEEDVDWKVVPIEGKGMGLVALRFLPEMYRIMVDAAQPHYQCHPKTEDLMPEGGSLEQKWDLNILGCNNEEGESSVLCVRISRANHSCDPNAAHNYDSKFKVKILFAERNIEPGEEITINYVNFKGIGGYGKVSAEMGRCILRTKWDILYPETGCDCRDEELLQNVERARALDEEILLTAQNPLRIDAALRMVAQMMDYHDKIKSSWMDKQRTLYDGFQIAVTKKSSLRLAREYIDKMIVIYSSLAHPQTTILLKYHTWKNDLSSHHYYLLMEVVRQHLPKGSRKRFNEPPQECSIS